MMAVAMNMMAMTLTVPTLECPRWSSADTTAVNDESDDKEDNVSRQEDDEEEIEVNKANSGELPPAHPLGRGLRDKKKQTHYNRTHQNSQTKNVSNVGSNVEYFQGVDVLNLSYRGQQYHLNEGVVNFNLDKKPGVGAVGYINISTTLTYNWIIEWLGY